MKIEELLERIGEARETIVRLQAENEQLRARVGFLELLALARANKTTQIVFEKGAVPS